MKTSFKAGVLQSVLSISIIITILVSAMILVAYYNGLLIKSYTIDEKLKLNSRSGINYLLATKQPIGKQTIDLFNDGKDSITIEKKYWGVFDIFISIAQSGIHTNTDIALVGVMPPKDNKTVLYLTDDNRPLVISGDTKITGDAFIPKAGIRGGFVDGKGYSNLSVIEGKTTTSSIVLPGLSSEFIPRFTNYINGPIQNAELYSINEKINRKITKSFSQKSFHIKTNERIYLAESDLSGNIIIQSNKSIEIGSACHLNNIILIAPKITLLEGFSGNLQAIASDTIIIEKKCFLHYPSALVINGSKAPVYISMDESAKLEGVIIENGNKDNLYKNKVIFEKETEITGDVYVEGMVELKGSLIGTIYCRRFFLKTPSTLYENYLMDARLNVVKLSKHFVSSSLLNRSEKLNIIQWLK